ncbi:MAG TPA: pyrroline-5-carboxylate reductase [Thermoguttaceae bacterium]|nr:pyrroline-5-carboxylate reductase [Thermoguttaceae bacterium]
MPRLFQRIGLIGAGRMATALVQGMVRAGLGAAEDVLAADPSVDARRRFAKATGAQAVDNNQAVIDSCDAVVLAVKPQNLEAVLATLRGQVDERHLVISILAGVRLATLGEGLGTRARLARVMPNTPCLVGQGASGYCLAPGATAADRALVEQLFGAVGLVVRVDEPLLDAVTGLSGSGPAFVYAMIEALADGGASMGLPRDVATRLAAQTVRGAAEMVLVTGETPGALKDRVASPGGTTVAGLRVLDSAGFPAALSAAVVAAAERSVELGGLGIGD